MKHSFTPGPWTIVWSDRGPYVQAGNRTLTGPGRKGHAESWAANARLIAAAPELLEALTNLQLEATHYKQTGGGGNHLCNAIETARAAIAKATGEK